MDEYRIEDISRAHPIDAAIFVPFVVLRLQDHPNATDALLGVTLRNIGGLEERRRTLRLSWPKESSVFREPGVSQKTITEWAALGIACVVVSLYGGLKIQSVTGQGDRFDYWLSKEGNEFGLEVSGTLAGDLEARHRDKIRQWQENPFEVDGFVVVVSFVSREIVFSYHRFKESEA